MKLLTSGNAKLTSLLNDVRYSLKHTDQIKTTLENEAKELEQLIATLSAKGVE